MKERKYYALFPCSIACVRFVHLHRREVIAAMKYALFVLLMSVLMTLTGCPDAPDDNGGRKCPRFQPGENPFEGAPAYCPESP